MTKIFYAKIFWFSSKLDYIVILIKMNIKYFYYFKIFEIRQTEFSLTPDFS